MADFHPELALLWCVLLNAVVLVCSYRFAIANLTADRVQAVLDAGLLWYTVQYLSVGIPGVIGILHSLSIAMTALVLCGLLWFGARDRSLSLEESPKLSGSERRVLMGAGAFAVGYVAAVIYLVRSNPVVSNDALTYHFPAAVQWLQTGRINLLPLWFFNPANTYSPLAGSMFIAWLAAPFSGDVVARFVQAPAALLIGLVVFQICRQLKADAITAALIGMAAVVSRPFINQVHLGKDDLFVVMFFEMALVALHPGRAAEPLSFLRLGLSVGLLLATKYTAMFTLPILLLAVDGPWRAGWRNRYLAAAAIALAVAGPWYLRNLWLTGNPIFPVAVPSVGLHRGLFTTAASLHLHSLGDIWHILSGQFAMPGIFLIASGVALGAMLLTQAKNLVADRLFRAVAIGPVLTIGLFAWKSPFPEARFVFPAFGLMFVLIAGAICLIGAGWVRWVLGAGVALISVFTAFADNLLPEVFGFATTALLFSVVVLVAVWLTRNLRMGIRWIMLGGLPTTLAIGFAFVYWRSYVEECRLDLFTMPSAWTAMYLPEEPMWRFVNQNVVSDSTVAYTNTYLIYPLQGSDWHRRLVYAPSREGMHSLADLTWLGDRLSGEAVVSAAAQATVADPDRSVWLGNLRQSGAAYLVIGTGGVTGIPPEAGFAADDPTHFTRIFHDTAFTVYRINWPAH